MNSSSDAKTDKTSLHTSSTPLDTNAEQAFVKAAAAALAGYVVASVLIVAIANNGGKDLRVYDLLFGFIPLHIAAVGCALLVLAKSHPRGRLRHRTGLTGRWLPVSCGNLKFLTVWLAVAIVAVFAATGITLAVFRHFGIQTAPMPLQDFIREQANWTEITILTIPIIVIAPIAEELLFRRIVPLAFMHIGIAAPWSFSALLFAAMHGSPAHLPGLFVLGLILNRAYYATGNLTNAIILHSSYNAAVLLLL